MWAKLAQLFIQYLLLPLALKGLEALSKKFKRSKKIKVAKEKAVNKMEAYKNAKTKKESDTAFSDLP